jgi:hypothetical protein
MTCVGFVGTLSESRMLEIGTSGLMSGDGKRDDRPAVGTRARPRLYLDPNPNETQPLAPHANEPISAENPAIVSEGVPENDSPRGAACYSEISTPLFSGYTP